MLTCPHCSATVELRELPYLSVFRNYRICPECEGAFTVDVNTKRRQAVFLILAIVSLVLTGLLYFNGNAWLPPALVSYAAMAGLLYWANKKVRLVPYDNGSGPSGDG